MRFRVSRRSVQPISARAAAIAEQFDQPSANRLRIARRPASAAGSAQVPRGAGHVPQLRIPQAPVAQRFRIVRRQAQHPVHAPHRPRPVALPTYSACRLRRIRDRIARGRRRDPGCRTALRPARRRRNAASPAGAAPRLPRGRPRLNGSITSRPSSTGSRTRKCPGNETPSRRHAQPARHFHLDHRQRDRIAQAAVSAPCSGSCCAGRNTRRGCRHSPSSSNSRRLIACIFRGASSSPDPLQRAQRSRMRLHLRQAGRDIEVRVLVTRDQQRTAQQGHWSSSEVGQDSPRREVCDRRSVHAARLWAAGPPRQAPGDASVAWVQGAGWMSGAESSARRRLSAPAWRPAPAFSSST